MRRCSSCGTRLSPEAFRCWLCHAPASREAVDGKSETAAKFVPRDHVAAGPLARTSEHGAPDPVAAVAVSRARGELGWLRVRAITWVKVLLAALVLSVAAVFLPVQSRAFVYGIVATVAAVAALHRLGRAVALLFGRRARAV